MMELWFVMKIKFLCNKLYFSVFFVKLFFVLVFVLFLRINFFKVV